MIGYSIIKLLDLYATLLVVRVLLTWFPIKWENQPFAALKKVADIYLEQFRKVIPPVGILDISPIVAFIVLSLIRFLLIKIFVVIGI
ncbi:YggT family protein [bacterium]|nr:YggT family protein [bacterium]